MNFLEGNKIVCHTASWLEVEVHRDGKIYKQKFESDDEGAHPLYDVKVVGSSNDTGTIITYVADPRVYGDIYIDIPKLEEMLKNMSLFSKGLKFILVVDGVEKIFYSERGLIDGLNNSNSLFKPVSYYYETPDCKVELAFQWVSKGGKIRGYANSLYVKDGGPFISQFKSSLTRTFNSLAKTKFNGEQIRNLLDGFVSVKVKVGQWSNQQKTALANPEAGTATSTAITNCLKEFKSNRPNDFNVLVELLERLEKAEKAAEKARTAVLNHQKKMNELRKQKVAFIDKLTDAEELGQDAILCIVEGNSAGNSVAEGRDTKKYGILRIRGKMINGLKEINDEEYYKNAEIELLLYALGINSDSYNPQKLRYGKIAICVDQDDDGRHIALLIMANLHRLCPQFLKENRLYWLQSPLFIEQDKKGNPISCYYSDEEFDKVRGTLKGNIKRVKGLGQLNDKDLKATMFSKENQRLDEIIYSEEGAEQLCKLMGIDIMPRKDFIFSNIDFSKYSGC